MSRSDVEQQFVNPLLRSFGDNKLVREAVEGQKGQLLILDDVSGLKKVLEATLDGRVPGPVLQGALKAAQKKAAELQKGFTRTNVGKRRLAAIKSRYRDVLTNSNIVIGKNAFVVTSFNSSVDSVKKAMLDYVQKELNLDDTSREIASKSLHKGHGEAGLAVSQVQAARAINTVLGSGDKFNAGLFFDNLDTYVSKAEILDREDRLTLLSQLEQLKVKYSSVVTARNGLKAGYFSVVTFQSADDNALDGVLEKAFLRVFKDFVRTEFVDKVVTMKGSPSLLDKVDSLILESATKKSTTNKNVRSKGDTKSHKAKTAGSIVKNKKVAKNTATILHTKKGSLKRPTRNGHSARVGATGVASEALRLMVLINDKLPETVRGNMGSPGLVNRTGKFAASTRVTDIQTTRQGYPSIGYTYQKAPYQIFEMGLGSSPWATPDRDPRNIIDKSIREIASELAIGRFYTRRV